MLSFLQEYLSKPGPLATFLASVAPSALYPLPYQLTHWVPGNTNVGFTHAARTTPLSTTPQVVAAILTYLVVIFGGRELMR
jgi:hypothetical protein